MTEAVSKATGSGPDDYVSLQNACCMFTVEHHSKSGNIELAQHIELWRGNVTEMLKEMARRKQLSDLLVSFAPMASQK